MDKYLGIDVHVTSCTIAVVTARGKRAKRLVVETNGQALVEAVRLIPGRKHICIEEGTQANWLYEILSPHAKEVVVASLRRSPGNKNDEQDEHRKYV